MSLRARVRVEACCVSSAEAIACVRAGADRIELCRDLAVGGLTPDADAIAATVEAVEAPVHVLIRPRAGGFRMTTPEIDRMADEVHGAIDAGAAGVVLGALTPDRRVDVAALRTLLESAGTASVTFHRAFDDVADPRAALGTLVELQVERILTSGGPGTARKNRGALKSLVADAGGRLTVIGAGGVRADHVASLIRETGLTEVHARAEAIPALIDALSHPALGGAP